MAAAGFYALMGVLVLSIFLSVRGRGGVLTLLGAVLILLSIALTVAFYLRDLVQIKGLLFYLFSTLALLCAFFVVIGVVNTVIGVCYYIRVIVYMYARAPEEGVAESSSLSLQAVLVVSGVAVVVLGVLPNLIFGAATASARALF